MKLALAAVVAALVLAGLAAPAEARAKPYRVSAGADRASTSPGVPVTVTGKVSPRAARKKVRLQVAVGAGWQDVASVRTTKKSRFTLTWAPSSYGTVTLRVTKGAGGGRRAGSSAAFVLSVPAPPLTVTKVAAGAAHACALMSDRTVRCWGSNEDGQRGVGGPADSATPQTVPGIADVVDLVAGERHTCAATSAGAVWCWGDNTQNQVADGRGTTTGHAPAQVPGVTATRLAAGWTHTCAIVSGGASCWGGVMSETQYASPGTSFTTTGTPVAISAGEHVTCALLAGGTVQCWGDNSAGQLGNGTLVGTSATPTTVSGVSGATALASGWSHSCAIVAGGKVRCWGYNTSGQLGKGDTSTPSPNVSSEVLGVTGASAIGALQNAGCARVTGGITCWGSNSFQRLVSNGPNGTMPTPAAVPAAPLARPTGGSFFVCALDDAGAVWCWGSNSHDELGRGASYTENVPTKVAGLT